MAEQLTLPGIEPRPVLSDRLMLVLLPDASAVQQVRQRRQALGMRYALHGRPIVPGRLHITLAGFGDFPGVPPRLIGNLSRLLSSVDAPCFTASLDTVMSFDGGRARSGGRHALVLSGDDGVQGVRILYDAIAQRLRALGFGRVPSRIMPHLTLSYEKLRLPPVPVAPVQWPVTEFVLARSLIGSGEPYSIFGRWPLRH
ncbi:2'-5' RNA ligase family protein [Massilia sp. BJB1822]|uniref:2'-5' RNA ligase family protein n=1 Tax=Massilia sp. BJB1822 TaxID=2744470 RepID=UPI00159393EB|nr:2'-5' RNA ligase family protein [Massilia sp. BJB1822]NVE00192.1 2'-5' RNA ligase family protein [Massilia sp. BJB1822]